MMLRRSIAPGLALVVASFAGCAADHARGSFGDARLGSLGEDDAPALCALVEDATSTPFGGREAYLERFCLAASAVLAARGRVTSCEDAVAECLEARLGPDAPEPDCVPIRFDPACERSVDELRTCMERSARAFEESTRPARCGLDPEAAEALWEVPAPEGCEWMLEPTCAATLAPEAGR